MNRTCKQLIQNGEPHVRRHPLEDGGVRITTFVPCQFKKRGTKKVIVKPEGVDEAVKLVATPVLAPGQDQPLLRAISRGLYWQSLLDAQRVADTQEIAQREGIHRSTVNDLLRLALLAPDIVQAVFDGILLPTASLEALLKANLPLEWGQQRDWLAALG